MNVNGQKRLSLVLMVVGMLMFAGCDFIAELFGMGEDEPGGEDGKAPVHSYFVHRDGRDGYDGLTKETPFQSLAKAYGEALANPSHGQIVVLSDLSVTEMVTLSADGMEGAPVTITGDAEGKKIERSSGKDGSVIAVRDKAKIIFTNITINGIVDSNVYHRALQIEGEGSEVTLGNGVVITGKRTTTAKSDGGAGILVVNGAKLLMEAGSTVTNCDGTTGSGIWVYGSGSLLTINKNASISENTAYDYGGGVSVYNSGAVVMNGGLIHGNLLTVENGCGGGVSMNIGTFTMNGGEISGNTISATASKGGGVALNAGEFYMNGGTISGNKAVYQGGGVFMNGGTFVMNAGVIYGKSGVGDELKNTASNGAAFYKASGTSDLATTHDTINK